MREEATGPTRPSIMAPPLACDCHMHVFGPLDRFPPAAARSYTPVEASLAEWRAMAAQISMTRVVVVQPSAYGADNTCLVDTLRTLGPWGRGVAAIDEATSDDDLAALDAAGVRGIRLNPKSIGAKDPARLAQLMERTAARIAPLRWHIQIYAELALLTALAGRLRHLAVPLVLDHMGGADATDDETSLLPLLSLLDKGTCWIKLSGAYRVSRRTHDFTDSIPIARALIRCNPERLVWGSDWPHTAGHAAKVSDAPPDITFRTLDPVMLLGLLAEAAGDQATLDRILADNPAILYGF